jgi:hypothetical protein
MTRLEAANTARAAGLENPRVIPHKDRSGKVVWHLCHGPYNQREPIVIPVDVDAKTLKKAIEDAQAS